LYCNLGVFLVLFESPWRFRFNKVYFTIFRAKLQKILIFEWILLLEIQTNCKNWVWKDKSVGALNVFTLEPTTQTTLNSVINIKILDSVKWRMSWMSKVIIFFTGLLGNVCLFFLGNFEVASPQTDFLFYWRHYEHDH
jgi:hypothetical protein